MRTHALQYNFVNSLTYFAQIYLFSGPVQNPIYSAMDIDYNTTCYGFDRVVKMTNHVSWYV